MLRFAAPALGIYVADPIMTNIDNGFVGRFSGTEALAALGPGNVMANNILFLFQTVLNAATTGLVSRALGKDDGTEKARLELSRMLSIVLVIGLLLTMFQLFLSGSVMLYVGNAPKLVNLALPYVRIRALAATAVLSQGICLSAILAAKDSVTPLRVVLAAALLNFAGDTVFCFWPFRLGVAGAALATTLSQFLGCFLMLGTLRRKGISPKIIRIGPKDARAVLEYAGPLFITTTSRVLGYTTMATAATKLGTVPGAAYQVAIGVFTVFAFVSAPLSQIAQTTLPALVDAGNTGEVRKVLKNLLKLAFSVSIGTAILCSSVLTFGSILFTKDVAVLAEVARIVPAIFAAASLLILSSSVDGCFLAAKDFRFIMPAQVTVCSMQFLLLLVCQQQKWPLFFVVATFPLRLLTYLCVAACRVGLGFGPLGKAVRSR